MPRVDVLGMPVDGLHRPSGKRGTPPMLPRCAGRGLRFLTMRVPRRTLPMLPPCAGPVNDVQDRKRARSTAKTLLAVGFGSRACMIGSMQPGCVNMWPESCAATEEGLSSAVNVNCA